MTYYPSLQISKVFKSEKSRPKDARDDENARLKQKVADLTMDNELLNEKIDRMEQIRPFAERRSK
jgi:hypothetical protein